MRRGLVTEFGDDRMLRKIAIFDYKIIPTNPIGGCHLRMMQGLCHEHDFTVFAVEFENPCPERIHWVRIPALTRPMALLFVLYHLLTPFYLLVGLAGAPASGQLAAWYMVTPQGFGAAFPANDPSKGRRGRGTTCSWRPVSSR